MNLDKRTAKPGHAEKLNGGWDLPGSFPRSACRGLASREQVSVC